MTPEIYNVISLVLASILGGIFTYLNTRQTNNANRSIADRNTEGKFYDQILEFADQTREDIASLKQENQELKAENTTLRSQNVLLIKALRKIRIEFNDMKEDRAKRANQIIKLEYEVRTLKNTLDTTNGNKL
jgi:cell division protein FtsB